MTLARDGPGSAAYFAAYEYIKRSLTPKDDRGNATGELSLPAVLTAGGGAGIAMWIPVFPVDTVKSRMQSAEGRPTIGGTIRTVYGNGGFKAFFPGFGPALARAVPANAATLYVPCLIPCYWIGDANLCTAPVSNWHTNS